MSTPELRIFVSSTTEDLKESCRPIAIDTIRMYESEHVSPVVMEDWVYEHDNAVLICQQELLKSSHYMGIFAYRHGWVPIQYNDKQKSITELEYDWAIEHHKPHRMFILIPQKGTKIDDLLQVKVGVCTPAEYDAQQAFLRRVKQNENICCFFEDLEDLRKRIRLMINRWRMINDSLLNHIKGLQYAANTGITETTEAPIVLKSIVRPQSFKREYGHRKHREQFVSILSNIEESSDTAGACFIIHGAEDHGHDELIDDLRRKLPPECCNFQLPCTSLTGNTAGSFFDQLANWLANEDEVASPVEMASAADVANMLKQKKLVYQHVVLQVHDINDFQGGIKGFLTDFWQPLIVALGHTDAFRLIVFVTVIGSIPDDCQHLFWQQTEDDDDLYEFNPKQAVVLPEIKPFSQKEIAAWLKSAFPTIDHARVQAEATNIFRRTNGLPIKVYRELQKLHSSTKRVSYAR